MSLSQLTLSWHVFCLVRWSLLTLLSDLLLKSKTHSYHSEQNTWERQPTAWSGYKDKLPESPDTWHPSLGTLGRAHLSLKGGRSQPVFSNTLLKEAMPLLSNGP